MTTRAFLIWLLLMVTAITNGALRQKLLIPWLGGSTAHWISPVILSAAIFAITLLAIPWLRLPSPRAARKTGAFWLALTLAFEFLAGHYLFHTSWELLLAEYDIAAGRLWILVLLATLGSPPLAFHFRPRAPLAGGETGEQPPGS